MTSTTNNPDKQLRQQSLDLLRFPLACIIVLIHVFDLPMANASQGLEFPVFDCLTRGINAYLRGICVPIYFFISGYVFFYCAEFTKDVYKKKIKNRVHSLLIPYLIWNAIGAILLICRGIPAISDFLHTNFVINPSIRNIASCFWHYNEQLAYPLGTTEFITSPYPVNVPLWFLRELIVVVLFAPALFCLLKNRKKRTGIVAVLFLGGLYIVANYLGRQTIYMTTTAFFFFSWGGYMSINKNDMLASFKPFTWPSIVLFLVCSTLYFFFDEQFPIFGTTMKVAKSFFALIAAFNIASYLISTGKCTVKPFLASASFFIYISHQIFGPKLFKILCAITPVSPTSDLSRIALYLITLVLTITILLAVFYFMKRFMPKTLKVIAGRK